MMMEIKAHEVEVANSRTPLAYQAVAVRHLVRHSQIVEGPPEWTDTDEPLRAAPKLKPPALPGDTYSPSVDTSGRSLPASIRYGGANPCSTPLISDGKKLRPPPLSREGPPLDCSTPPPHRWPERLTPLGPPLSPRQKVTTPLDRIVRLGETGRRKR